MQHEAHVRLRAIRDAWVHPRRPAARLGYRVEATLQPLPVSAEQVAALASPGETYEVEKCTLRFRANATLPYDLVTRLVQARATTLAAGGS